MASSDPPVVPILLPLPLDEPFDYLAPPGQDLVPGRYVRVPFGAREVVGVAWDLPARQRAPRHRLKHAIGAIEAPAMPLPLRRLLYRLAAETLTPLGTALRLAMSVPGALEPEPPKLGYRLAPTAPPDPVGAAQRRVLDCLARAPEPLLAASLAKRARTTAAVLRRLAEQGHLLPIELLIDEDPPTPDTDRHGVELEPGQRVAAEELCRLVRRREGAVLLDGVPGSGKTEVYFEAIAEALRSGLRALVLLPEIALSAQWLARFERRFGVPPVAWHSGLTPAQRRKRWQWVARGRAPVVVGARSALFLPLTDVGLIVVDEEHDTSFKQEEGAIYSARDMALRRAELEGCAAILCSATPSIETAYAAGAVETAYAARATAQVPVAQPGWGHVTLPDRRGRVAMPRVELVDLRRERPPSASFLSPPLRQALAETLAAKAQALLFLNRRGYAPLTLCRACGHRLRCPNCSAWLTSHRLKRRLTCHHCGYSAPEPDHCPHCGAVEALAVSGPGVERVAEEVAILFPEARAAVMTSDTVGTAAAAERLVGAMAAHEVDILIGTQMVAKGHHFPDLLLVGVVDADLGLGGGDLRASERSFQLLYQVAGRAGRADRPGRVLVQTHLPDHPVMQALLAGERDRFLAVELEERRESLMPPFGRLAAIIVSAPEAERAKQAAQALVRGAPEQAGVTILGPAPSPLALLRGRWRERLLIKSEAGVDLPRWLRRWLAKERLPSKVELAVDVDPQSFL